MAVSDFKGRWYYYLFLAVFFSMCAILTKNSEVAGLWIAYVTIAFLFATSFLVDWLFSEEQFVYDPDPNSWRRKTDPQM